MAAGLTAALADSEQSVFWLDSPEAPEPRPPLEGDLRCELAVIGGGFTGLWAALLAVPDEDVVLLEGDRCGWAASGRNGGFLDASLTHGLENGLARWPDEIDRLLELGRENFDAIRETLSSRGIDAAWEENGFIDVATRAHEVEGLAESAEIARRHGEDVALLDREAVRTEVDSPTYLAGLLTRGGGALVDPARLAWGLRGAALEDGVRIFEGTTVTRMRRDGEGVLLETPAGRLHAARVVLATNAFRPLARSIAQSLGRKFVRVSLGGMRDEAEIRGHRRTYIGALPGQVIQGLRRAESKNPVFILDEIDKLGSDFRGDPASALLEVLDPEQNNTFRDHYLDVPFDLSEVLFLTTANVLDPVPPALRDRMEVLELAGYTEEEKLKIAVEHLVGKQIVNHGLTAEQLEFNDAAIRAVIRGYTREAGVRNLEREIGALCRKVARRRAEGDESKVSITPEVVVEMLGAPTFLDEEIENRTKDPGVAVGLAWTPAGGEVLFVEASRMQGGGSLTLTGQLGDVMKESGRTALSWFRSNANRYGVDPAFYKDAEIHLHVPSGAIPKDGPSAGVTMVTALASQLTGRPVRGDIAMTGEITLSGRVLPVGGIKEKVLAARRHGITEVILPRQNEKHIKEDLTDELRRELTIHYVIHIEEVLAIALQPSSAQTHTGLPLDNDLRQTVQ